MSTFEFYTPLGSSWIKTDTFGGSLTENIIQALTRDVLRDGLLGADKAGFKLVGHVHDEAIAEGADNANDLAEFERVLCESSEWADGFPIKAEGYLSKRYRK
jgi:DNA polymerase